MNKLLIIIILTIVFICIYCLFRNNTIEYNIRQARFYHENQKYRDINKALRYYKIAADKGSLQSLFDIATIYHWGIDSYKPNKSYAKNIYLKLLNCPNNYYKTLSNDRLKILDREYKQMLRKMEFDKMNNQMNDFYDSIQRNRRQNLMRKRLEAQQQRNIIRIPIRIPTRIIQENTNNEIRNDPQNVHDHVVVNTIKESINNLRNSTRIHTDVPTSLSKIRELINKCDNTTKRDNAIKTLDTIERNSDDNLNQIDLLHLVWNRINSDIHTNNSNSLKENLINELSDSVENGNVVCASGRQAHILETLNVTDPEVEIKPKWALNQQLMNYAAHKRNTLLKNDNNINEAMNTLKPTPEQEKLIETFNQKFKNELIEDFNEQYVKTGTISQEILNAEVNKWIDEI